MVPTNSEALTSAMFETTKSLAIQPADVSVWMLGSEDQYLKDDTQSEWNLRERWGSSLAWVLTTVVSMFRAAADCRECVHGRRRRPVQLHRCSLSQVRVVVWPVSSSLISCFGSSQLPMLPELILWVLVRPCSYGQLLFLLRVDG